MSVARRRGRDGRRATAGRATHELSVARFLQPDDVTCGPTCLRKVYDYYGAAAQIDEIISETRRNPDGGTLAVFLGLAALAREFRARIFAYDLRIFDPSWFGLSTPALAAKVRARIPFLSSPKTVLAAESYLEFLRSGGEICFEELTPALLKRILDRDHPVLAGLSATYLYRVPRERHDPRTDLLVDDDVRGQAVGHFIVVCGYEQWGRDFVLRDPSAHVPVSPDGRQVVEAERLINAILLGDLTYDAVLLEIWPEAEDGRTA